MSSVIATVGPMGAFRVVAFGLFGLAFGSFLTVVVWRTPRHESVVAPGSACPSCGTPIRARDNVPVASFLLLRGRCRHCGTAISPEYPAVEAATALLFVAVALAHPSVWAGALLAPFAGLMLAGALIDARHRIIPNAVTYPALVVSGVVVVAGWLAGGGLSAPGALAGLAAFGGGLLVVALVAPSGMGMGDVKLAAVIGLVLGALGLRYVAVAAGLAILAGGIGATVALVAGRSRRATIPFGPFLAAGAVLSVFLAPAIAGAYLRPFA